MNHIKNRNKGFTLLEILLVVAIISILAGIVIVAINPAKQLGDARNAQRKSDVQTILNAVYQYVIDNQGTLPASIPNRSGTSPLSTFVSASTTCFQLSMGPAEGDFATTTNSICKSTATTCSGTTAGSANVNLANYIATTTSSAVSYLTAIPSDPSISADVISSGYTIAKIAGNRIAVCAPLAENGVSIGVVR